MTERVFSTRKVDHTKQPMFFGEESALNIARYDVAKYPVFLQSHETQLGFFWNPKEHNLNQDRIDFKKLTAHEQHIFTSNLKYQTLLDSVQGRAPSIAFLPYAGIPELELVIDAWTFFESLHSFSYTHIIRTVYDDPSKVFDEILDIPEIIDRAKAVTVFYDDFIEYAEWHRKFGYGKHTYSVNGGETQTIEITEKQLKKKLYLALLSVYILEGIRFYASFACSFAFGELKKMVGNANIISQIARDENQHLAITATIIKNYQRREGDAVMLQVMKECEAEAYQMFSDAVEVEKMWCDYLFKDGSIIGLNANILKEYLEHIANKRMRSLGFKPIFVGRDHNPIPWIDHWLNSKSVQVAPQELEKIEYIIAGAVQDVSDDTFKGFQL